MNPPAAFSLCLPRSATSSALCARFGANSSSCSGILRELHCSSLFMTLTEKILARAAGKANVSAGENVWVKADVLMTHDVCGPGTIGVFKREFGQNAKVWDQKKVVIIPDHY